MTYESEYFWKVFFFNRLQFGKESIIDFWLSEYTIAICDRIDVLTLFSYSL